MTTRRKFIGTTAAAVAATAVRATGADAHLLEEAPQQGGALPPAIAALQPMTAGVKPITVNERRARVEKATRLMREQNIDAMMLTGGTSLDYFTSIRWGLSERMLARGETPFLDAWAQNEPALRIYRALGFAERQRMSVVVMTRPN